MGFDAASVDKMSVWQFQAAQSGFAAAHGASDQPGLSEEEFSEIAAIV